MAELAVRSGLAEEQIERIENNVDLPSLAPHQDSPRVRGTSGHFSDDQEEQGAVICRKQESEDTISFSNNAMDLRTHMRYHSLSKSKADRHMEPFIVDVEPTEKATSHSPRMKVKSLSMSWKAPSKYATVKNAI